MKWIAQISRVLVGVLFIVSGFIKANDTIGFGYKLEEYFEVFHTPIFIPYVVPIAMFICIFEIMVGVALLLGAYSKLNAWLLLLMILFFTWLTGYSALTGKVTDCGCFGDAIKLKPVESFIKDLVLLVFIIFIFIGKDHIKPLFNQTIQTIGLSVGLLVTTSFTLYTYMFLPRIDFLPYKVGNDIKEKMSYPEGAARDSFVMTFIYSKEGTQYEFTMDQLASIDASYTFVDRKDKLVKEGYKLPIPDFKLSDMNGIDYTDSLLSQKGYRLIIVQKDVNESRSGSLPQVAKLAMEAQQNNMPVWGLTATPPAQLESFRHEYQLAFTYYNMDVTPLKSMIRSNPGIILMKDNVVVKKWSAFAIPTYETLKKYMR